MYPRQKFTFAVQAAPARNVSAWPRLARDAEELGYRALLVPDHIGSGGPISGMAVAGAATTSLAVGPLVMGIDFHHPVVLAQELLTLDGLLGGRLEIGLGAGWMRRDYERAGITMAPARERIERLEEFVDAFLGVWTGGDHHGPHYRFPGAGIAPAASRTKPTIVLGGGGPRMLKLAARQADIVNLGAPMSAGRKDAPLGQSATHEAFLTRISTVAESAERQGRWPRLQCLAYETCVTADATGFAHGLQDGFGLPVEEILRSPLTLIGTVDELCAKIQSCREQLGISYWVVKSPVMYDFAPVVARLAGC